MGKTQIQGQRGEKLAAEYLQKQGLKIIAKNVRTPFGELDLVCKKGANWIFVEVKARNSKTFGNPEDALLGNKLGRLKQSIDWFVSTRNLSQAYQLDALLIENPEKAPKFLWLKNIS